MQFLESKSDREIIERYIIILHRNIRGGEWYIVWLRIFLTEERWIYGRILAHSPAKRGRSSFSIKSPFALRTTVGNVTRSRYTVCSLFTEHLLRSVSASPVPFLLPLSPPSLPRFLDSTRLDSTRSRSFRKTQPPRKTILSHNLNVHGCFYPRPFTAIFLISVAGNLNPATFFFLRILETSRVRIREKNFSLVSIMELRTLAYEIEKIYNNFELTLNTCRDNKGRTNEERAFKKMRSCTNDHSFHWPLGK